MATSTTRKPPQPTRARATARPPWVWIGVAVVVVAAFMAAVLVSRSGGGNKVATGVEQTRPVTIIGAPLKQYTSSDDPTVGTAIPSVTGQSFDGTPVSIIDDGKPKLVLFVAHWCPHCQREVPLLADYLKANPLPAGLELFTIATATDSAKPNFPPSAWLEGAGWPGSTIADDANGSAAAAFGLPGFPYFVAVDSHNKVIARTSGEIPVDQFSALVQKALTG